MKYRENIFDEIGKVIFNTKFVIHIYKHLINPLQPWDRVFSRKKLKSICQKLSENEVETVYDEIVNVAVNAINFSISLPLYAYKQVGKEKTYYFIAEKGFLSIVRDGYARTIYFPDCNLNESNYALFNKTWRAIKRKTNRINWENKDNKLIVKMIKEEFWHKCPNPYKMKKNNSKSYGNN